MPSHHLHDMLDELDAALNAQGKDAPPTRTPRARVIDLPNENSLGSRFHTELRASLLVSDM
jgi:hypothetical protein